jgi:hypothetical protein
MDVTTDFMSDNEAHLYAYRDYIGQSHAHM